MWLVSKDGTRLVVYPQALHEHLLRFCASATEETGGILVGRPRSDGGFQLTRALPPPLDSRHGRHTFRRGTRGALRALDHLWERGELYAGEWHLHPNSATTASPTDTRTMRIFAHDALLDCPHPILLILGSGAQFSLYKFYDNRLHKLELDYGPDEPL